MQCLMKWGVHQALLLQLECGTPGQPLVPCSKTFAASAGLPWDAQACTFTDKNMLTW